MADTDTDQDPGSQDGADPEASPESDREGRDSSYDRQISELRRENASWRTRLRQTEAELNSLQQARSDDVESAVARAREEARRDAYAEAVSAGNRRLVEGEILAAAAGARFTDPADAVRMLNIDDFPVSDDGSVDRSNVKAAVENLVKSKPYLTGMRDGQFGSRRPPQLAQGGSSAEMNDWIRSQALRR